MRSLRKFTGQTVHFVLDGPPTIEVSDNTIAPTVDALALDAVVADATPDTPDVPAPEVEIEVAYPAAESVVPDPVTPPAEPVVVAPTAADLHRRIMGEEPPAALDVSESAQDAAVDTAAAMLDVMAATLDDAAPDDTAALAKAPPLPVEINPANPGRFRALLAVEEERTADGRIIAKGATAWRTPPLPLMLMTRTDDGHDGAEIAGVIEKITRKGMNIIGEGRFDTGISGVEAARLVADKMLTGVSIDAGDVEAEIVVEEEDPETGIPTRILARMTALTILGATVVPFPAIGSTTIEWLAPASADDAETLSEEEAVEAVDLDSLAAAGPIPFPAACFANPQLVAPTPLRVLPDGTLFGHAALWSQCHISFGTCVTPPRSRTEYAHFLTGSLPLVEGGYQPVGRITLQTGHADQRLGAREAEMHYDNTGAVAAYVNVGEDEFGIWVAGVLKPTASAELATELCGASLSGDWRRIGGNLELVGLLGVNVPGYPVAHTRNDEQMSLVPAGFGPQRRTQSLVAAEIEALGQRTDVRVAALEAVVAEQQELLDRLTAQVAPIIRERLAQRFAAS